MPIPPPLILGSTSAYRRELLARLKLTFEVANPGVEESILVGETPSARARRLALAKATAVATSRPEAVVIGSDQVAVCNDTVLDKPGDAANCRNQLRQLSGSAAEFHTAVAVVWNAGQRRETFEDLTTVHFRILDADTIDRYIAAERPFDCAGGFRSEALGISLFERVAAEDATGLVGLPLIRLAAVLRSLGYAVP